MRTPELDSIEKKIEKLSQQSLALLQRELPKGTRVKVPWGNGVMLATVVYHHWNGRDVLIESDGGGRHYKHYHYISKAAIDAARGSDAVPLL